MISMLVSFKESVLLQALKASSAAGMGFDEYLSDRIMMDLDTEIPTPPLGETQVTAQSLFLIALNQPIDGPIYLVEDLYEKMKPGNWGKRAVGNKIAIGKSFKSIVDAAMLKENYNDAGVEVVIIFVGKTSQNQAQYQTKQRLE